KENYLAEIRFTPDVDGKRLLVTPLLNTATERDDLAVKFTAHAKGKVAGTTVVRVNREGILNLTGDLKLWSPESPFLYDLTAELVKVKAPYENRTRSENRSKLPSFGEQE